MCLGKMNLGERSVQVIKQDYGHLGKESLDPRKPDWGLQRAEVGRTVIRGGHVLLVGISFCSWTCSMEGISLRRTEACSCNTQSHRKVQPTYPTCSAVLSLSVVSNSATPWTVAHQAPLSMEFSRQVGCHALLQEIFPTQGSNPGLPHCR